MADDEFPAWMDKTGLGAVGVFTLDDGEQLNAEIVDYDEYLRALVVDIISPGHTKLEDSEGRRSIQISRIVDFEPQARELRSWPYSDPCRGSAFSLPRFVLMATMFLLWGLGGVPLFFLLGKEPYALQEGSAVLSIPFEVFFTFAATKNWRAYSFSCPAVQLQLPRLFWRHLCFLGVLVALQTFALAVRPHLPDWWNIEDRKGGTPFDLALLFLSMGLAFAQVYLNRSLLKRAHREFSGEPQGLKPY